MLNSVIEGYWDCMYNEQPQQVTAIRPLVWCCKDKEVGSETNTHYSFLKQNKVSSTNLHYIKQCFCLWDIFI